MSVDAELQPYVPGIGFQRVCARYAVSLPLGDQVGMPELFKAMLGQWLSLFHVAPRYTLRQNLMRLADDAHMSVHVQSRFRGYAMIARLDRAV